MKPTTIIFSLGAFNAAAASRFPQIKHHVAFGDSYTDEGRLNYIIATQGELPPAGWAPPVSNLTSTGGYIWARFVAEATNATLHDYAVGGATCSNKLTPVFDCPCNNGTVPSIEDYEVPTFLADFGTKEKLPRIMLNANETVYTIWIGTNDLGPGGFLDDEQVPGVSLVDFTSCAVNTVAQLYQHGARNFIVQNLVPLYRTPQYATLENGGVPGSTPDFTNKDTLLNGNLTAISERIRQIVLSANQIWKYQLPAVAATLPDAKVAYFDSHQLFLDIIEKPQDYLTAPYNTTGYMSHCVDANCTYSYDYDAEHKDGYLWVNQLHPSEIADKIVAKEIVKTLNGESKYATYYF